MPREKESDRRGGRGSPKYPDEVPRSRGDRDGPSHKRPKNTGLNDYFVDGDGINRDVLQRNIAFMLGPEARSKPDSLHVGIPLKMCAQTTDTISGCSWFSDHRSATIHAGE